MASGCAVCAIHTLLYGVHSRGTLFACQWQRCTLNRSHQTLSVSSRLQSARLLLHANYAAPTAHIWLLTTHITYNNTHKRNCGSQRRTNLVIWLISAQAAHTTRPFDMASSLNEATLRRRLLRNLPTVEARHHYTQRLATLARSTLRHTHTHKMLLIYLD